MDGVLHQGLELVPVLTQQLELKVRGNRVHAPGLGHRLKPAHQKAAHLFLVVDEAVRVAHDRQHGVHALDLASDDVKMLSRVQRHVHPGEQAKLARPLAGAVHQHLAAHLALGGAHTFDPAVLDDDAGDLTAFLHAHPPVACPLGQRHAQVGRVGLAVTRQPDGAVQVVGAHHRVTLARLLR